MSTAPEWLQADPAPAPLPWLTTEVAHDFVAVRSIGGQLDRGDEDQESIIRAALGSEYAKDDGRTWFVASTDEPDRHGDIVEQSWRLAPYRRNPVLLLEHGSHVIGRGTVRTVKGDDLSMLILGASWHRSEKNPEALLVAEQHDTGFRSAASVGFMPGQAMSRAKLPDDDSRKVSTDKPWTAGMLYRFPTLLEVSSVAVPANASALQIRAYAAEAEDPAEQLRRLLKETTGPTVRSILRDALRDNAELRRALLGTIPQTRPPDGLAFLKR